MDRSNTTLRHMIMRRKKMISVSGWLFLLFIIGGLLFGSCNKDHATANAVMEIRLTDAPGDFQQVNIDIQEVQVHAADSGSNDGWRPVSIHAGVYDLMKLTNGLDTLLGNVELPAGHVSQIRFVLGSNNSIKLAGQMLPLTTPSAQQSGLKLLLNTDLKAGVTYKVLVDFDAARSIVSTGNGKHLLKPVLRTVVEATSGAIKGVVNPAASRPAVYAIMGSDTLATTFADSTNGSFIMKGLEAGTYTVDFAPKTGYSSASKANVSVTVGAVTDIGVIQINP